MMCVLCEECVRVRELHADKRRGLSSRVNTRELLINTVTKAGRAQRTTPQPNWYMVGCLFLKVRHVDMSTTGEEAGPTLFVLLAWNWVSPYRRR